MSNELEHVGFTIIKYGFFYLWPLPLEWDKVKGRLSQIMTFWRVFFLIINLCMGVIIVLIYVYVIGTHFLVAERKGLDFTKVAIMSCTCCLLGLGFFLVGLSAVARDQIELLNLTMELFDILFEKYPLQSRHTTLLERLLIMGTAGAVVTPWMGLLYLIPNDFDPLYFILEDWWYNNGGTSQYDRTRGQILWGLLARSFILLGVFEGARILGSDLASCFVIFRYLRKVMEISISGLPTGELLLGHKYASILFGLWGPFADKLLSALLSTAFWSLVMAWWIVIKTYGDISLLTYLAVADWSVGGTAALFLALTFASQLSEAVEQVIKTCGANAALHYSKAWSVSSRKEMKIRKHETKAMRKITLSYYPFMAVDREFGVNVMVNLVDRLWDAVLIF